MISKPWNDDESGQVAADEVQRLRSMVERLRMERDWLLAEAEDEVRAKFHWLQVSA